MLHEIIRVHRSSSLQLPRPYLPIEVNRLQWQRLSVRIDHSGTLKRGTLVEILTCILSFKQIRRFYERTRSARRGLMCANPEHLPQQTVASVHKPGKGCLVQALRCGVGELNEAASVAGATSFSLQDPTWPFVVRNGHLADMFCPS